MRVAVTGAAGYLGRPIVEALARDDRVDSVLAIDLRPPPPADGVEPLRRDVRELYNLEGLWGDAPHVKTRKKKMLAAA